MVSFVHASQQGSEMKTLTHNRDKNIKDLGSETKKKHVNIIIISRLYKICACMHLSI